MKSAVGVLLSVIFLSCSHEAEDPWKDFAPFNVSYDTYHLAKSEAFALVGANKGTIDGINELSGLAKSKMNKGGLWAHNDSGNQNIIYLLDENSASVKASYRLIGVNNDDWEDIAVGPGPTAGVSYIYLGDIGDNQSERVQHIIYRFPEPLYATAHAGKLIEFNPTVEKIVYTYPDGAHNAETLLLDPVFRDLYVVTKYGSNSIVFVARYPQPIGQLTTLTTIGRFPFREATGGDISEEGGRVAIRTYDQLFYWKRKGNQPLWQLLAESPELLPYNPVEPKGEAFAWTTDGYLTANEKENGVTPVLYFYQKK